MASVNSGFLPVVITLVGKFLSVQSKLTLFYKHLNIEEKLRYKDN